MIPKLINGQWRVVYDGRLDWVKRRGLAGEPCNGLVFNDEDGAWAYIDKFEDVRGQF